MKALLWLLLAMTVSACATLSGAHDKADTVQAAGSKPDGGTDEDDMSAVAPHATRYLRELKKVETEGAGDVNGDGVPDMFQENLADGTVRTWTDDNGNGRPELVSEDFPSGDNRTTHDGDEDGRPDLIETSTAGPPMKRVTLRDDDQDGRFERREILIQEAPGAQVRVIFEQDLDGDGVYTVASDTLQPDAIP